MAKTQSVSSAKPRKGLPTAATRSAQRRDSAYREAWEEIDALEPGEMVQYHEGNLGCDVAENAEIAGRAAAYRHAATDMGKGTLAQRRIRFEWYQYLFRRSYA